jgi:arylsulfatase A-like enzyme
LLRLDQGLTQLLHSLDKEVGLDNVLIILSADHGVSDNAAWLSSHHIDSIKPVNTVAMTDLIHQELEQQFKLPPETLSAIVMPYIYLNRPLIHQHKLRVDTVSNYLAEVLRDFPGVYKPYAMSATDDNKDWIGSKVDKMTFPLRSGELYIVTPPWQSYGKDEGNKVTHGSPWEYDSYVPLIFASGQLKPQTIHQPAYTTDIAITLAQLLGIKAPAGNVGHPLTAVLE